MIKVQLELIKFKKKKKTKTKENTSIELQETLNEKDFPLTTFLYTCSIFICYMYNKLLL